jgi:hypothetical protein
VAAILPCPNHTFPGKDRLLFDVLSKDWGVPLADLEPIRAAALENAIFFLFEVHRHDRG